MTEKSKDIKRLQRQLAAITDITFIRYKHDITGAELPLYNTGNSQFIPQDIPNVISECVKHA